MRCSSMFKFWATRDTSIQKKCFKRLVKKATFGASRHLPVDLQWVHAVFTLNFVLASVSERVDGHIVFVPCGRKRQEISEGSNECRRKSAGCWVSFTRRLGGRASRWRYSAASRTASPTRCVSEAWWWIPGRASSCLRSCAWSVHRARRATKKIKERAIESHQKEWPVMTWRVLSAFTRLNDLLLARR